MHSFYLVVHKKFVLKYQQSYAGESLIMAHLIVVRQAESIHAAES